MSTPSVKESRRSYLVVATEELVATVSEASFDPATFFEKFELLVHIPEAVHRFRELIIENCVLGRFTTTDESETVASDYQLEPSFPACNPNWRTLNFGKHCDIQGGNQPPKSEFIDEPKDGYIRLLQIRDLGDKPVPTYIPVESTNRFCTDGEILIGRYGASVGKIFWAQPGAYNVALAKFIYPSDAYIPIYAFWLLKSAVFQRRVLASSRSAQAGFNKGDLASIDFPLPPIAEQKRIVGKVDELMGLCDRLEALEAERKERHASLSRAALARFADSPTPTNLQFLFHNSFDVEPKELRKTLLRIAVAGVLSGVETNTVESETTDLASLVDLQYPISYGVLKPGPQVPNGIRLIKSQHIRDWKVADEIQDKISLELDAQFKRTKIKGGEILLNLVGASIGRCAIAPQSLRGANVSRAVAVITVAKSVDAKFMRILLTAAFTPDEITRLSSGTAQPVLNLGVIRTMKVWLPPLAEQKRIVAKVDELMALVDQLEQQLAHSRTLGQQLLEAVVAKLTAS